MGPFLMENSGEEERTYLFSFGAGMQMALFCGQLVGGISAHLDRRLAGDGPTDYPGLRMAMGVMSCECGAGTLPLLLMQPKESRAAERSFSHLYPLAAKIQATIGKPDPAHADHFGRRGFDDAVYEHLFSPDVSTNLIR